MGKTKLKDHTVVASTAAVFAGVKQTKKGKRDVECAVEYQPDSKLQKREGCMKKDKKHKKTSSAKVKEHKKLIKAKKPSISGSSSTSPEESSSEEEHIVNKPSVKSSSSIKNTCNGTKKKSKQNQNNPKAVLKGPLKGRSTAMSTSSSDSDSSSDEDPKPKQKGSLKFTEVASKATSNDAVMKSIKGIGGHQGGKTFTSARNIDTISTSDDDSSASDSSDSDSEVGGAELQKKNIQTKKEIKSKEKCGSSGSSSESDSDDEQVDNNQLQRALASKKGKDGTGSTSDSRSQEEVHKHSIGLKKNAQSSESSSESESDDAQLRKIKVDNITKQAQPSSTSSDSDAVHEVDNKSLKGPKAPEKSSDSSDSEPVGKITASEIKRVVTPGKKAKPTELSTSSSDSELECKDKSFASSAKGKTNDSSSDDESENDSEDDSEDDKRRTHQIVEKKGKKGPTSDIRSSSKAFNQSEESSEASESSLETSESESDCEKVVPTVQVKRVHDGDSSSYSEDEPQTKKLKASTPSRITNSYDENIAVNGAKDEPKKPKGQLLAVSTKERDLDGQKEKTPKPKPVAEKNLDLSSTDSDDSNEREPISTTKAKAYFTPNDHSALSKTIFVGNLAFSVTRSDIEEFFKDAGDVVDVRLANSDDGWFRGFGHVDFATKEAAQKAFELNGHDLLGREIHIDFARGRGSYTPFSGKSSTYQTGGKASSNRTIFVRGFDNSADRNEISGALQEHFGSCGNIIRTSVPLDYETGAPRGVAYLEFEDANALSGALNLNGSELGGFELMVEEARARADGQGGRSGGRDGGYRGRGRHGSRSGGRDGAWSGGRDGGRGGRGSFRGRGRGFSNKSNMVASGSGKRTKFDD